MVKELWTFKKVMIFCPFLFTELVESHKVNWKFNFSYSILCWTCDAAMVIVFVIDNNRNSSIQYTNNDSSINWEERKVYKSQMGKMKYIYISFRYVLIEPVYYYIRRGVYVCMSVFFWQLCKFLNNIVDMRAHAH